MRRFSAHLKAKWAGYLAWRKKRVVPAPSGSWLDQTQKVTAIVALAGIFIFGVLMLAYGQFYRELGMSLNDVGVEYGKALGGVAGLTIVLLISTVLVVGVLWLATILAGRYVALIPMMFCTFTVLALIAAVALPRWANARASHVKQGKPSESIRILGVEILSIRAAPANVQLIQSEEDSKLGKSVRELKQPLFYVGQGRGQLVLYEQPIQRAVFIPLSLVGLLQTSNCETHRTHEKICKGVAK